MYGMPSDLAPTGFDTSMLLLSGYLLGGLAVLIFGAMMLGILTLPVFFLILWVADRVFGVIAARDRLVPGEARPHHVPRAAAEPAADLAQYLALFVLTLVLCLIYAVLHMIGNATREKEANFKAIVTHKTLIPSQMPPGYYTEFKDLLRR